MPADVSILTAQLAALNTQINRAILAQSVQQGGGSSITQQDLTKLISARNVIQTQIDRINGVSPMIQRGTSSGLSAPPACGNGASNYPNDLLG